MARDERFTFLTDRDERQTIALLAKLLRRTESDAVRFIAIEAAQALDTDPPTPISQLAQHMGGSDAKP